MPIPSGVAQSLLGLAEKLGPRLLYPGIPFFFVPALIAGLIGSQFNSDLIQISGDAPIVLDFPSSFGADEKDSFGPATLLLVPKDAGEFLVPAADGGMSSAWIAIPKEKLELNRKNLGVSQKGLWLSQLLGVRYPLAVFFNGTHKGKVEPIARLAEDLNELELGSSESSWIVLFLLGGAVFGFGASAGFVKDGLIVQQEDTA